MSVGASCARPPWSPGGTVGEQPAHSSDVLARVRIRRRARWVYHVLDIRIGYVAALADAFGEPRRGQRSGAGHRGLARRLDGVPPRFAERVEVDPNTAFRFPVVNNAPTTFIDSARPRAPETCCSRRCFPSGSRQAREPAGRRPSTASRRSRGPRMSLPRSSRPSSCGSTVP